jgi:hypothetical protein
MGDRAKLCELKKHVESVIDLQYDGPFSGNILAAVDVYLTEERTDSRVGQGDERAMGDAKGHDESVCMYGATGRMGAIPPIYKLLC